jgi:hypothetical protein
MYRVRPAQVDHRGTREARVGGRRGGGAHRRPSPEQLLLERERDLTKLLPMILQALRAWFFLVNVEGVRRNMVQRVTRLCVTAALLNLAFTAGYYGAKIWDTVVSNAIS